MVKPLSVIRSLRENGTKVLRINDPLITDYFPCLLSPLRSLLYAYS